jgi:hypothetical protein
MLTKLQLTLTLPNATPAAKAMAAIGGVGRQFSALQQLWSLELYSYETSCFEDIEESVRRQYVLVPAIKCLTNLTFLYLDGVSIARSVVLTFVTKNSLLCLALEHHTCCCDCGWILPSFLTTASSIAAATPEPRTTPGVQHAHDLRITLIQAPHSTSTFSSKLQLLSKLFHCIRHSIVQSYFSCVTDSFMYCMFGCRKSWMEYCRTCHLHLCSWT